MIQWEEATIPERLGPKHWRERAEEARTLADQMNDGDARRSSGALHAMLEAARGLPDLLKARREAMEARWRAAMEARSG